MAADFYVNTSGADSNNGLSPGAPWRTVTNINSHNFVAGDAIHFAGGQIFVGGLVFDSGDQGNPSSPILVNSYGAGRAVINAGTNIAFAATNCSGFVISNLNFVGADNLNTNDGIRFICELTGDVRLPLVVINSVDVGHFGGSGISIGGWQGQSGYRDVFIMNTSSHHNVHSGISVYARSPDANTNVYIGHCETYNNVGDASLSGSGIVLGGVKHGTVEWCVSHDNGEMSGDQGPVGIWAYNSSDITIQFNESHHNRSITGYDGGGFDFDVNSRDSVMQYNYSHDNDGPGLLQCCGSETSNNIIRYNVSDNDSRVDWAGAITTYGNITDSHIYNNTVYYNQVNAGAVLIYSPTTNLRIRNNIIWAAGGRVVWIAAGQNNLLLQGNDYWSGNAPFLLTDGNVDYTSFFSWRSGTGREHLNGSATGFNVDPKLTSPGNGPTFNDATLLTTLSGYKLRSDSPLIDVGLNLPALNEIPGSRDFYGNSIPLGNGFEVGAHELLSGGNWRIESPQWRSNSVSFTALGPIGMTNQIEASTNLVQWVTLLQWVNTNGSMSFTDPVEPGMPKRFYRLHQR